MKGKIMEGRYFYPCKCGRGFAKEKNSACLECRIAEYHMREQRSRASAVSEILVIVAGLVIGFAVFSIR